MLEGMTTILGVVEGMSTLVVLLIVIIWAVRQIFQATREGKSSSVDLAESTLKLLADEQRKTFELNERVDNLFAENRNLRVQIHDLEKKYSKSIEESKHANSQIEALRDELKDLRGGLQ